MKKKILALAVSGGLVAAPMGAMAAPEVYGLIDIGVEHYTDSDGAATWILNGLNSAGGNSDARDVSLTNGMQSRLGVRGSEELGVAGLTASYNMEFTVDVLNENGGGLGDTFGTRLGWAALGGDWGKVKVGSQWQALYEFGGWNTHRTDVHGYGTYFYTTEVLSNSQQYGFRQSSAISYEYGSAWGHSDPFAAQVTLGVGEGSASTEAETVERTVTDNSGNDFTYVDTITESEDVSNQNGITSIQVAAQYTFIDSVSVNGVYVREFNDYGGVGIDAEYDPELYNIGARWSLSDELELSMNYTKAYTNNATDDERDSVAIASMMDFGGGLSGHLGVSQGSADDAADIDTDVYGYVRQALSDRTNVRLELEHMRLDDDSGDKSNATIALVALQHSF